MADSVILSPTPAAASYLHRCDACVFVCVRMVSGIGILTVFHIREGETSECYCKRSTSCLISKNPSLSSSCSQTQTHTHRKILTSKICFLFLSLPLSIFSSSLFISLCFSLYFSNKQRFAAEGRQGSADERIEKTSTRREDSKKDSNECMSESA